MRSLRNLRAAGIGLCLLGLWMFGESRALARRRLGVVQGRILLPRSRRTCRPAQKAYWRFSVPNVTPPSCSPALGGYLVTLDEWDAKAARRMWRRATKGGASPRLRIYGVSFVPRYLLVPKEEQSYQVVITNQDRFVHEIYSPDKKGDDGQVVAPDGSLTENFDGLKPLENGEAQFFRLRCKRFAHMRGAVVFVRSTALALPGPKGRFRIPVSQGKHLLRVWHDGKKVAERQVTVGRRPSQVTIDLRGIKARGRSRARARTQRASRAGTEARARARDARARSRHRRHGRRRRRRRRRH